MSHPCRRPSLVPCAFAELLARALGLRRRGLSGDACASRVGREPRRRDLFRPAVVALENREGPTTLFGLPFPPLFGSWLNLGNLRGGGRSGAAKGSIRGTRR
jgi:hypothetical protein